MNRGFTLIETVIYLGLFAVIMTGVLLSAYSLIETAERSQTVIAVQDEGTFLARKLNWAIAGATAAGTAGPTTLTLQRPDLPGDENPLTIRYDGVQYLTLERGTHGQVPLNSETMKVTNATFTVVPATGGRPPSVSAVFSISGQLFTFSTYLRK